MRLGHLLGLFVFISSLSACSGNSGAPKAGDDYKGARYVAAEDHFSICALPAWRAVRERGAVVFADTAPGHERATIAIRAVPIVGEWTEARTPEVVLPATEQALNALAHGRVSAGTELSRTDFRAMQWDLVFDPPGVGGRHYARRHVVLIGDQYVIHVIHTAPEGQLDATAATFQAVVDSLKEEV